jgi:hypothetical protein
MKRALGIVCPRGNGAIYSSVHACLVFKHIVSSFIIHWREFNSLEDHKVTGVNLLATFFFTKKPNFMIFVEILFKNISIFI